MNLDMIFDAETRLPNGQMRAVRISQDHQISIVAVAIPKIAADEVLIKPASCGICGTDLHILTHGFVGTNYPVIPIHEFCGHIVEVGGAVKTLREGDFVVVDPNVVDVNERWSRAGRPNLSASLTPIGVGRAGAAADYVAVPARNAFLIDEKLGHGVVTLTEPLACALHAVDQAQYVKDSNILIFGGGTMGLLTAIAARSNGAGRITLVDISPEKLEIARKIGVDEVLLPQQLGGELFDIVFEAAGVPVALKQALTCLEKTGTLVQIGVHEVEERASFNPFLLYEREWRFIGSNSCADKFPAAVALVPDIRDKLAILLGKNFPVWDFAAAIESMKAGESIKTLLSFTSH